MPPLDPLSQLLGAIDAKLEMVLKTQSEDREAAAKYRTDMRRDLGEVKETVQDLKNQVNNTADELAEIRPDVEDYRLRRAQGQLAMKFGKGAWTLITTLGISGMVAAGAWLHSFFTHKP